MFAFLQICQEIDKLYFLHSIIDYLLCSFNVFLLLEYNLPFCRVSLLCQSDE